ncbi:MAG: 3'-5' exoribonuclease [Desulfurellales bacterium]|nr:MAG: 3'-5' exoribonuclease [Desulfurellales bacterium]
MDLMVDIETFGIGSKAVIHEIGAVIFDPYGAPLGENPDASVTFHALVDPQSCFNLGMEVDWSTLKFWFSQGPLHMARLTAGPRTHIANVLMNFSEWVDKHKPKHKWGHGATFDPIILHEYYKKLRKPSPFEDFRTIRDTRTLFDEVSDITRAEWDSLCTRQMYHHPLHDAWAQARCVQFVKQQLLEMYKRSHDGNSSGARGIPGRDSSDTSGGGTHGEVPPAA